MWYDDDNLATSLMETTTTIQSGVGHQQVSAEWVVGDGLDGLVL